MLFSRGARSGFAALGGAGRGKQKAAAALSGLPSSRQRSWWVSYGSQGSPGGCATGLAPKAVFSLVVLFQESQLLFSR